MSVIIKDIEAGSAAAKAKISPGDTLVSLNGNEIFDVLDYRFYQAQEKIIAEIKTNKGKIKKHKIKKQEYDEIGLLFDTYLMDEKRSCKNKCIFCFIDQLPKGLRDSLYFKDDDSRLSFLFGNYVTLTNLTERDISRIIDMHISPVNISVHTTNPELRVKMMTNKNAGKALQIIPRLNAAGIKINCQLVLVPGFNDGEELVRSLKDLSEYENVDCIAAVPVGLTRHREGLCELESFNEQTAANVIDIIDKAGDECIKKYGSRRIYAADEFYLLSGRKIPDADYYGDFLQLENGVGLWALLKSDAALALEDVTLSKKKRHISIATGVAAYPLIREIADNCESLCVGLKCDVYAVKNNFFGEKITVAGLVTATDIIEQLSDKDLGEELLIPEVMLNAEGEMFLDSITLSELQERLSVKLCVVKTDGFDLVEKIINKKVN